MTGWPWPLDAVQSYFENLWNYISSAVSSAISVVSDWIWGAIRWLADGLQGAFIWLKDSVTSSISAVSGWIWSAVNTLDSWIHGAVNELWGWVSWGLNSLSSLVSQSVNWLSNSISWGLNSLSSQVGNFVNWLNNSVWSGLIILSDQAGNFANWLNNSITGGLNALSNQISAIADRVVSAVRDVVVPVSEWISKNIASLSASLKAAFSSAADFITKGLAALPGLILDAIGSTLTSIRNILGGLSTQIVDAVTAAYNTVVKGLEALPAQLAAVVTSASDFITAGLAELVERMKAGVASISDMVAQSAEWFSTSMVNAVDTLTTWLASSFGGLKDYLSEGWTYLSDKIVSGSDAIASFLEEKADMIVSGMEQSTGEAVGDIGSLVSDALAGVAAALGEGLQAFWNWLRDPLNDFLTWLVGGITWIGQQLASVFTGLGNLILAPVTEALKPGSPDPLTEQVALDFGKGVFDRIVAEAEKVHRSPAQPELAIAAGAGVLGAITLMHSVGQVLTMSFDATHPVKKWGAQEMFNRVVLNLMGSPVTAGILGVPVVVGIIKPMTQAYNKMFTPEIPGVGDATRMFWRGELSEAQFKDVVARLGYGDPFDAAYETLTKEVPGPADLIRFVVREVIEPKVFTEYMGYQGFSAEISEWFWEAHWMLPGRGEIVDAFHRGILKKEERDTYMVLHDFKDTPRPGIEVSDLDIVAGIAKTLIPRVDLRYAWEMGQVSDEDLEDRYKWLGYEDDALLMADIQRSRALTEEIHKVRDEWIKDFLEGYIGAETLRANLAEIGIGAVRIDYYVTYALMRREREHKKDLLAYYLDAYLKDLILEEAFEDRVYEILDDLDAASLFIEKAYTRKYQKPKPPQDVEAEKAEKELYKYRVSYARELYRMYAIEKPEMSTMWVEAGMDPAVAATRADFEELKRPIKKPLPEIIARAQSQLRIQKLKEATLIEEFRKEVRTAEQLLTGLTELAYSEALAMAITQLEIIRALPKPEGVIVG